MTLLERCSINGGLVQELIRHGLMWVPPPNANLGRNVIENAPHELSDDLKFTIKEIPLPKLDTPAAVESAALTAVRGRGQKIAERKDAPVLRVLRMQELLYQKKYYGPYLVLLSRKRNELSPMRHDKYESICQIDGIVGVVALPEGSDWMGLVQVTPDVIRLISLPDRLVPHVRADFSGNVGIAVAEGK